MLKHLQELGYQSLNDYLLNHPEKFTFSRTEFGEIKINAVASKNSIHILKMIDAQKPGKWNGPSTFKTKPASLKIPSRRMTIGFERSSSQRMYRAPPTPVKMYYHPDIRLSSRHTPEKSNKRRDRRKERSRSRSRSRSRKSKRSRKRSESSRKYSSSPKAR